MWFRWFVVCGGFAEIEGIVHIYGTYPFFEELSHIDCMLQRSENEQVL